MTQKIMYGSEKGKIRPIKFTFFGALDVKSRGS